MSDFQAVLTSVWDLFGIEFTIYGFTFSFRQVLLWGIVAVLLIGFIGKVFGDDQASFSRGPLVLALTFPALAAEFNGHHCSDDDLAYVQDAAARVAAAGIGPDVTASEFWVLTDSDGACTFQREVFEKAFRAAVAARDEAEALAQEEASAESETESSAADTSAEESEAENDAAWLLCGC